MVTEFWQGVIWKMPTRILEETIERDMREVEVARRFLSTFPDSDPRGNPALREHIEMMLEDIRLMADELFLRKQPGPREWSPRGIVR